MPSIPLPFVVSLVLCLVLVRMIREGEGRLGLFPLLVVTFALQGALSGASWSFGWPPARAVQPILAAVLPALSFVAFDQLRHGPTAAPSQLWPHLVPAVIVACLVVVWREPIDLVLFAVYLGYGLTLLHTARKGPGALAATRFGDERAAHKALLAIGIVLVANAFIDAAISLDLAFGDGHQAMAILTAGSVLWLGVAGYAATIADASRPGPAGDVPEHLPERVASAPTTRPPPVLPATEMDAGPLAADTVVLRRVDSLMTEQHLYRDPDLTLERLARRAGIPARQISGALNRIQGRNVSQVVNAYRVDEARRRLLATNEPITTILLESGFGTKSNFNREFLRVTGLTPSAYRRTGGTTPGEPAARTVAPEAP
ncbi:AraC family transcriptional regulator [Aureimonas sp. Leaf460]|uniref:helix-turn-helix transcriptional regulator n=2 Tax=unclassified Aureimonas TaxID=2615206 RepID=UPI0006FD5690|nr:AraC family transcriptional regulator [Aureimonas sp. Leaf460]KQT65837.1 AraC family transcriptional regulator [Aureimonas sp. Leaf427]KQT78057.1 AraC family transcriptional regulator [Aureimonas sp. Leaf460]